MLFDLDGTLLNTLADIADSMNQVLSERGFPTYETDAYRHFVGGGALALVERTLPAEKQTDGLVGECVKAFRGRYASNWNVKSRLYGGVPEMLDSLTRRSVRMAVFSNKPQDFVKLCLGEYLSNWDFAAVLGQREGLALKPDPAGAFLAARSLGVEPAEVLYVGDTSTDMKTALNAGMFPLGVLWGFRSEAELREYGAAALISHPLDILDFVTGE